MNFRAFLSVFAQLEMGALGEWGKQDLSLLKLLCSLVVAGVSLSLLVSLTFWGTKDKVERNGLRCPELCQRAQEWQKGWDGT